MFDTTKLSLSADEEAKYLLLVREAKFKAKPEAATKKKDWINKGVIKLVKRGVGKEQAKHQISLSLESGELYGHHILYFQEGDVVTVSEVLNNPEKYDDCTLADPFEPEYHNNDTSVAKFYAESLLIHSFAHGGKNYSLKESPDGNHESWLAAGEITESIQALILKALPDIDIDKVNICRVAINKILSLTFWDANKGKFFSLSKDNVLNMYGKPDGFKFLCKVNGRVFDQEALRQQASDEKMTKTEVNSLIRRCESQVIDYLEVHNQRTRLEMCVDMFAHVPRIEMQADIARIVFVHVPYNVKDLVEQDVIKDYKQHFPLLDEFISFLIASRFVRDRKKSYLWFLCESDWGKGFLMGILKDLNASIELSIKEIEKIFEGGPVGRSMSDFKNAISLVIDEFKTVKSEVKQLQSTMTISPKFQSSTTVEIYSKLFFSAESVDSLVGDTGVEDQFVNRFSLFNLSGDLTKRDVYKARGSGRYFDSVHAYVATEFNLSIKQYQLLGKSGAEKESEVYINEFVSRHGMGNSFKRLSESIEDISLAFAQDIYKAATSIAHIAHPMSGEAMLDDSLYLTKPTKAFEDWIKSNYGRSEQVMLNKKRKDVFECLSVGGEGVKKQRVEGVPRDSIKIKYELYSALLDDSSVVRSMFG